jgi:hypothetical protein
MCDFHPTSDDYVRLMIDNILRDGPLIAAEDIQALHDRICDLARVRRAEAALIARSRPDRS